MAVLQAGEYPLWFQFTDEGPVLLESIYDACFSAALIPWPLALHSRAALPYGENLAMAVNRDGFICFSPQDEGIALYRVSGGEFRRYTVGAFVLSGGKPVALLYNDDRFIDSGMPPPSPRLWAFDLGFTAPQLAAMPALDAFAAADGWDVDTLRLGADGCWHFRAVRKGEEMPEIRMFRAADLAREGEQVSRGAFQNAAAPEPFSAAPEPLREMLDIVFAQTEVKALAVISPEFPAERRFAADRDSPPAAGFYSGTSLLAALPGGAAFYIAAGETSARRFSLPPLPEGFAYTGIGMAGDTLIASWEEQDGYSIGAAGFTAIRRGW
jgi:hypothetical protein